MDWLRIYFDFINGLFYFFTLEFLVPIKNKHYSVTKKHNLRLFYLIYTLIYAIPKNIPFSLILDDCMTFLYIYLISGFHFKTSFKKFITYQIYIIISASTVYTFHCVLTNDFFLLNNELYVSYKNLICSVIAYILPCLFVYTKRLIALPNKKRYGISFCISITLSVFVLSYLSLTLLSGHSDDTWILPVIFSFIFIIIAICLSGYNHILLSLEENARQQVLISKYELENNYYQNIKSSMDSFRSLRHDFKNHLIILNGYAAQKNLDRLQEYLGKISDTMTDMQVIQTPHDLTSAILNAKAMLCQQKNIHFHYKCCFQNIYLSDFHLITILGNLLDNAITAAGKLDNGSVSFSMEQTDTYLHVTCKNNHRERIIEKNGTFQSTRENPGMFHGLGIKNIQNSVHTLNGTLDIQYDDAKFVVLITVPNYI